MPSDMTFRLAFGSWGQALRAAGFTPSKWIPTLNGVTRKGTRNKRRKLVYDQGYLSLFEPTHPLANSKGYVRQHRMILWDAGILTDPSMQVHHLNGKKRDNRIENLAVVSIGEHTRMHWLGVKRSEAGQPCRFCQTKTRSAYRLCRKHYKREWQRGNIGPHLLDQQGGV